ncbi:ORF6N domain-containing protein [Bacteroides pyogenes]|uniref:ORF6N domain-containing protein n=1 Tax=Bacteroides pyogenes TaxID=310300 RepID=UPI001F34E537|nr:ORF6N domain-containing protein [Bacteroides pyogenes]MCE9108472.1 ORF6N domain-containing protein [Bacteroides pyogenes]MCF2709207.1 ORF6N domain-containing protein [Bacteroides pyogenes]MDY4248805.1 ORF6N domain-containing protein [Bacteroides pyogenes]
MENEMQVITTKEVENLVIELKGQKVLLDRDIAALYGTETKEINKAVRNNPDKFPEKYFFTLQVSEKQYVVENFHQMQSLKKSTVEPKAFTEGGLYMLATILKSPRATNTTIAIIDTFIKLRDFSRCVAVMSQEPDTDKRKSLMEHNSQLLVDLLATDGEVTENESTIELNLAVLKIKRTIKKTSERKSKK